MKKLVVLRKSLLPISETFIKEQFLNLKNWDGILIGENKVTNGLDLNGVNYIIYGNTSQDRILNEGERDPNLVETILNINPDLIHVHFSIQAVQNWESIKNLKTPIVITLHGYDITIYKEHWHNQKNKSQNSYPEKLILLSKEPNVYFIAVSEAIKKRAIEYGINEKKITVKYIGIDTNKFKINNKDIKERKKILFIGRLVEKKGIIYLLQAYLLVCQRLPSISHELVVAGDGKQYTEAVHFAEENNLNVKFLGAISHEEVYRQLSTARVFCLPSICAKNGDREGLPTVILEAQAVGIPVITSAHGGATEGIIDGVTGFSFPEKNVEELARLLIKLLKNDELVEKMSAEAVKFVRNKFDISECTKKLELLYDQITNQP